MIVHISTKLLLIGIVINYNHGSFILAVISFTLASINIASLGLPICMEEVLRAFGENREGWKQSLRQTADLSQQDQGSIERIEPYFDVVGGPRFKELPDHRKSFDRQGIAQYP
jgi:hypothetical protein